MKRGMKELYGEDITENLLPPGQRDQVAAAIGSRGGVLIQEWSDIWYALQNNPLPHLKPGLLDYYHRLRNRPKSSV
jgi:hypothetical protein